MIDGKYYYKASVIHQLLNDPSSSSSKDRLRRVRSISKYADDRPQDIDIEDIIILVDPLVFMIDALVKLGSVKEIKKGEKKVRNIALKDVVINLSELNLEIHGIEMKWLGDFKQSFAVEGKCSSTIQPEIKIEDQKLICVFNKSLTIDIGIQSMASVSTNTAKKNVLCVMACFPCKRRGLMSVGTSFMENDLDHYIHVYFVEKILGKTP